MFSPLEPVNRATAAREFRVFHAALHSLNSAYRDSVSRQTHSGKHCSAHGDTPLPPSLSAPKSVNDVPFDLLRCLDLEKMVKMCINKHLYLN